MRSTEEEVYSEPGTRRQTQQQGRQQGTIQQCAKQEKEEGERNVKEEGNMQPEAPRRMKIQHNGQKEMGNCGELGNGGRCWKNAYI